MLDDSTTGVQPSSGATEDWRKLAEEASNEKDPRKLVDMVERLCNLLDQQKKRRAGPCKAPREDAGTRSA